MIAHIASTHTQYVCRLQSPIGLVGASAPATLVVLSRSPTPVTARQIDSAKKRKAAQEPEKNNSAKKRKTPKNPKRTRAAIRVAIRVQDTNLCAIFVLRHV